MTEGEGVEEPIATLESAGVEEADAAVRRAKDAFPGWRAVTPRDRAALLRRQSPVHRPPACRSREGTIHRANLPGVRVHPRGSRRVPYAPCRDRRRRAISPGLNSRLPSRTRP